MPLFEISSLEYLNTRTNGQIKADLIDYLRMAEDSDSIDRISAVYRRLAASQTPEARKPGEKPERREIHSFTMTKNDELSNVFVNVLEAVRVAKIVSNQLSWLHLKACRLRIVEGKSYEEIAEILKCHRDTASIYVSVALDSMINQVRQDAEAQDKMERSSTPVSPPLKPVANTPPESPTNPNYDPGHKKAEESLRTLLTGRRKRRSPVRRVKNISQEISELKQGKPGVIMDKPRKNRELPEDGCRLHPSCFNCPEPDCVA